MKTTLFSIAFAAACTVAPAAHAQAAAKLVPAQSEITFVSRQMGVPVDGTFRKFDAQVALDPKKPEAGSVLLTIDTRSATLGVPETDAELMKPNWFDAAKSSAATFQSSAVKALGAGRFEVAGTLTIKGVASKLVVPVSVAQAGGASVATGAFTIKRLDYRIGEAEWADVSIVANEVQVRFKLTFTGMNPL